jgi:hypothetical protein
MRRRRDDTDYDQRTLANLTATIALLLMALALTATVRSFQRQQTLERCLASGRRDCAGAPHAPIQNVAWRRR